ncbi:hypothetical protein D3C72_1769490 [compost metagenome]
MGNLFAHPVGAGHADQYRLNGQQAARQQGIALQRHRQREDKFDDQQPTRDEGVDQEENQRIDQQEDEDGQFVPVR